MTAADSNIPPAPRGAGGEIARSNVFDDPKLIERALRRKWNIPESAYQIAPLEMLAILTARDEQKKHIHKPRERINAARVLALFHAQNQIEEPAPAPPQTHLHEHRHIVTLDDRRAAYLARLDQPGDGGGSP